MPRSTTPSPAARTQPAELALCLSGGGYRAAIFHLGALWRLHEIGLLRQVARVSSVSGGSITNAFLMSRIMRDGAGGTAQDYAQWCDELDFARDLVAPFRTLTATDIRTWPVLKNLIGNLLFHRYGAHDLARAYDRLITKAPLSALPDFPNAVFCATDLTFGVNWEFSKQRVGNYQAGYLRADHVDGRQPHDFPIALAVAASSCFPPIFGPLRLDTHDLHFVHGAYRGGDRDRLLETIDLTDGGVYDNLAMEPVIKGAAVVLVSDGGAPFPFRPSGHTMSRLLRYTAVIGNQAVALRKRLFNEMRALGRSRVRRGQEGPASGMVDGVVWSLARPVRDAKFGYSSELIASSFARLRTDMDRFTRDEFEILINHGYAHCVDSLPALASQAIGLREVEPRWPFPAWSDEGQVEFALRDSHRRFSWRRLRAS
jgi:NTE family protein